MTTIADIKRVAAGSIADTVGKNKAGNIVLRRGYFYRNGMDSDKFAHRVLTALADNGIPALIVSKGDIWKPFRGGATTANSSHFFVEVTIL